MLCVSNVKVKCLSLDYLFINYFNIYLLFSLMNVVINCQNRRYMLVS